MATEVHDLVRIVADEGLVLRASHQQEPSRCVVCAEEIALGEGRSLVHTGPAHRHG
jgi:hypothetical protein